MLNAFSKTNEGLQWACKGQWHIAVHLGKKLTGFKRLFKFGKVRRWARDSVDAHFVHSSTLNFSNTASDYKWHRTLLSPAKVTKNISSNHSSVSSLSRTCRLAGFWLQTALKLWPLALSSKFLHWAQISPSNPAHSHALPLSSCTIVVPAKSYLAVRTLNKYIFKFISRKEYHLCCPPP